MTTQRQLIHSVDAEDYAWLKALAEADGCGVGEIVRRCVRWARESQSEPSYDEVEVAMAAQATREAERQRLIVAKQAELDALINGDPEPIEQNETSVLDLDLSDEPRAEEIEVPSDPDDAPPRAVASRPVPQAATRASATGRAVPSLLDSTAMSPPPSGVRPGSATRPAAPRSDAAFGLKMGDAQGNVVRANYGHLGFSRGGV